MAWKCDVCGGNIHLKRVGNKNYPVRCPYEKFKNVKLFYSPEFNQMINYVFFDEFPLSDNPEDLKAFSELIPDETPINKYVKKIEDFNSKNWNLYTKSMIIQGTMETFFTHFTRFLIDAFDDNKIHYLDSPRLSGKEQFNYLWLSPTTLRECYFREGRKDSRFKSMTELGNPSLVIYPIGNVMSVTHGAWGDILLDLITHRQSLGKPTWIVKSKEFSKCPEITSSDNLRTFLTRSATLPTVVLDEDEDVFDNSKTGGNNTNNNTNSSSYI